jgi:hypothetical protein
MISEFRIRCIAYSAKDLEELDFLDLIWECQTLGVISEQEYLILTETLIPW